MIIDLQVLPEGTEVSIKVTTELYIRLQEAVIAGFKGREDLFKALELIKQGKAGEDPQAFQAHLLLHLIGLIEASAKDKIVTKKFDTETGKIVS